MTIMERAARASREIETNAKTATFGEWARCLVLAQRQGGMSPIEMFEARNPRNVYLPQIKAAVEAGSRQSGSWAEALGTPQVLAAAFIETLRATSVVEQLRSSFRTLPFNVKAPRSTVGTSVNWTGEGRPVQATSMSFDAITFGVFKIGGIVVVSDELIKSSDPAAASLIRADLAESVSAFTDLNFSIPRLPAWLAFRRQASHSARHRSRALAQRLRRSNSISATCSR